MREDWNWKEKDGDEIYATWKESVIKTWNRRIERLKKEKVEGNTDKRFRTVPRNYTHKKKKMKHCAAPPNCLNFG